MHEACINEQTEAAVRLGELSRSSLTGDNCDLPPLLMIPAKENIRGREKEIRTAAATYFTAMQEYTACVQGRLLAVGGAEAPPSVKSIYVARNNAAVAEAEYVMKLFTNSVPDAP